MQSEIQEQPALLAQVASEYAKNLQSYLRGRSYDIVLLAARGSSDHAALYARYLIEVHLGIPAVLAAPSVWTRYHARIRYPKCLAIGISQSGSAPDVSDVLSAMREEGHDTLAITNTPHSRLENVAAHTLQLAVGQERSVAATKTYTASLLALYQVAVALGAPLAAPRSPDDDWLRLCEVQAEESAHLLATASPSFALGRGYAFATASEAALKLMECALLPCKAYSSADFEHGPKALAGEGSAVLAFSPVGSKLRDQGATIIEAPSPSAPDECAPMWQALYAQWLALHCARLRDEDPDKPQFIQKITRTR